MQYGGRLPHNGLYDLQKSHHTGGSLRRNMMNTFETAGMDMACFESILKTELDAEEPSVIISRRPCALLKYVKHPGPIAADAAKCAGCHACMKIGCPAISMQGGRIAIDATLCTGCGVCSQLCKFGAIGAEKEG